MASLNSSARKALKRRLLKRDGPLCFYCFVEFSFNSGQNSMTIDHKVPESRGGTHDEFNLVLACYTCNQAKAADPYEGFLISPFMMKRRSEMLRCIR